MRLKSEAERVEDARYAAHCAMVDLARAQQAGEAGVVVVRVYTEDDLREAVRAAYEDAARIVAEPRGRTEKVRQAWRLEVAGICERIEWRGNADADLRGIPGQGALPRERVTASARGLAGPCETKEDAERLGVTRR